MPDPITNKEMDEREQAEMTRARDEFNELVIKRKNFRDELKLSETLDEMKDRFGLNGMPPIEDLSEIQRRQAQGEDDLRYQNLEEKVQGVGSLADQGLIENYDSSAQLEGLMGVEDATRMEDGSSPPTLRAEMPWDIIAFGYILTSVNEVKIREGRIWFQGSNRVGVSEDTLTLTGSSAYVGVQYNRQTSVGSIFQSSTMPVPDATNVYVPKYLFQPIVSGIYSLREIFHIGDIHFDLPL